MQKIAFPLPQVLVLFGSLASAALAIAETSSKQAAVFVEQVPAGYRDYKFVSLAREESPLDDIRVILGNDVAIKAYRDGRQSFPDGAIIARLAYAYEKSAENDAALGREMSHVAGAPKNGLQFMVKNAKKYAATGGWGYAQFDGGKLADTAKLEACYPCHQAAEARDFVFTRYAP